MTRRRYIAGAVGGGGGGGAQITTFGVGSLDAQWSAAELTAQGSTASYTVVAGVLTVQSSGGAGSFWIKTAAPVNIVSAGYFEMAIDQASSTNWTVVWSDANGNGLYIDSAGDVGYVTGTPASPTLTPLSALSLTGITKIRCREVISGPDHYAVIDTYNVADSGDHWTQRGYRLLASYTPVMSLTATDGRVGRALTGGSNKIVISAPSAP